MEETLLEKNYKGLDLGDHFTKSKASLINFKEKIEGLKLLKNDCNNFIYEYFLNLRNEIDLDREEAKELIDKHYLGLISEVDKIEAKCKGNSGNLKGDYGLEVFETDFERLKAELNKLEINTVNWDKIVVDSNKQNSKLGVIKKSLECELILDKAYKFLPIMDSLKNEIVSAKVYSKIVSSLF